MYSLRGFISYAKDNVSSKVQNTVLFTKLIYVDIHNNQRTNLQFSFCIPP